MDQEIKDKAFVNDENIYNKTVKAVPHPEKEIGIDLNDTVLQNIVGTIETSNFDINSINSFTQVSQSRNQIYDILDTMCEDSTIAAVIETYAEDATETNDNGSIMWAESSDPDVQKFITYLLNSLNVDKNIYGWTHSLCKYGDVYLRLYRESDYDELLFDTKTDDKKKLNEDVIIKAYQSNDRYIHYLEQVHNPAQVFELTRFGKTAAYIKTDVKPHNIKNEQLGSLSFLNRYTFNKNDVELYQPTEFVHASLKDNSSRTPEQVELFVTDDKSISYTVNRGQSLLYNMYKVWRELSLLENSVLLNRVTQSSIVRVIGVEVGDMPKESVQPHLSNVKQLIEQKAAIATNVSMNEYSNPGPIVNNVYVPTREGKGVFTTQQIGGDVNIGDLVDLEYYQTKLFGGLRIPKQYFGLTSDSTGFNGGTSLSIISSRYAKMIKRIQNTMIQMITDAINLILIDTGNESYINKFTLKMLPPTTQEEVDRRDNLSTKVSLVRDIMDILTDIENTTTKLKILKSLLSDVIIDSEVTSLIQDEIETLEAELEDSYQPQDEEEHSSEFESDDLSDLYSDESSENELVTSTSIPSENEHSADNDKFLPSPEELGAGDFSDSTNPEFD